MSSKDKQQRIEAARAEVERVSHERVGDADAAIAQAQNVQDAQRKLARELSTFE